MLNLASKTDPAWVVRVLAELDELLLDHAHCEKKAAGMAVQLLFRYPQHTFLMQPLSELAREELSHFEQVLGLMRARGIVFRNQRPAPYAGRLRQAMRTSEPGRLVDILLCCALIEARSCERFQLLANAIDDPELAALYAGLLVSEARHHRVYVDLAAQLEPAPEVGRRLVALAEHEAAVLRSAPDLSRMHT